jgi:hypothetical protein
MKNYSSVLFFGRKDITFVPELNALARTRVAGAAGTDDPKEFT